MINTFRKMIIFARSNFIDFDIIENVSLLNMIENKINIRVENQRLKTYLHRNIYLQIKIARKTLKQIKTNTLFSP
jgi:hypothetical protein